MVSCNTNYNRIACTECSHRTILVMYVSVGDNKNPSITKHFILIWIKIGIVFRFIYIYIGANDAFINALDI